MTARIDITWPIKTREIQDHHVDSTLWNSIKFRDSDIVIASYPKSGTTWTQQIVAQLLFHGAEGISVGNHSPWIEARVARPERAAQLEAQTHRRFFKTHLPVDALRFSPKAKYIYVGRDGRDVAWSLFNHYANATNDYYRLFNDAPGRIGPPLERPVGDAHDYYIRWFEGNGHPVLPFWESVHSWWAIRELPNVLLIHFNDLKEDITASVRRIAAFLSIQLSKTALSRIVDHCSFAYMKAHANLVAPGAGALWRGGAQTFINKGTNGRWRDTLRAGEIAAYEAKALAELGPACAGWLANGRGA